MKPEDRILDGYSYQIGGADGPRPMVAYTGSGGAREYIRAMREHATETLPHLSEQDLDWLIMDSISVHLKSGTYKLHQLKPVSKTPAENERSPPESDGPQ